MTDAVDTSMWEIREPKDFTIKFINENEVVGQFYVADGKVAFEGDADASATIFIENVIKQYDVALRGARYKALEEAAVTMDNAMANANLRADKAEGQEKRDYQTSAICHLNAAKAIRALKGDKP